MKKKLDSTNNEEEIGKKTVKKNGAKKRRLEKRMEKRKQEMKTDEDMTKLVEESEQGKDEQENGENMKEEGSRKNKKRKVEGKGEESEGGGRENRKKKMKKEVGEELAVTEKEENGEVKSKKRKNNSRTGGTGANLVLSKSSLQELAKELWDVSSVETAKLAVKEMVKANRVGRGDAGELVRLWRRHRRQVDHQHEKEAATAELLRSDCETLWDVKRLVNEYVARGKIGRYEAGIVVKQWKLREQRRVKRQTTKSDHEVCFHCREGGHRIADCPARNDRDVVSGLCFKCGSTEHISAQCPRKHVRGFPYATCFVCKRQGHISRDCEQNANGIYPDGGACNLCGSQLHLKKDCPQLRAPTTATAMEKDVRLNVWQSGNATAMSGGDDEMALEEQFDLDPDKEGQMKTKKKVKVVLF